MRKTVLAMLSSRQGKPIRIPRTTPMPFGAAASKHPEVVSACTVTGDVRHFEQVVERIGAEPFVIRTRSSIVLSRLVERPDALPLIPD